MTGATNDGTPRLLCSPHLLPVKAAAPEPTRALLGLPNAGGEPRPMAEATQERRLLGVGSTALLGQGMS